MQAKDTTRNPLSTISRPCAACGQGFFPRLYQLKIGQGLYCSHKCGGVVNRRTLADRFWSKVDKNGPVPERYPELGPCWIWTGSERGKHYGGICEGGNHGRMLSVHRVGYELLVGPIPDGMFVCHHCDNRLCVGGEGGRHLFLGTGFDNMQDMTVKQRNGNGSVKLTEQQVLEMRALAQTGMRRADLARRFDVHPRTISQIVTRQHWKHI